MNDVFKTLATTLGSVAPTLATMLGGPFAGAAVSALEGAFGLQPGAGADAITKVVQTGGMTPEIMAAVRAADQKHAEVLGQQGIDLAKLNADHEAALAATDAADRDSARKREMVVKDNTPAILAYGILSGFFGLAMAQVICIMGYPELVAKVPPQGWVIVGNISGYLAAEAKAAASYFFGSTAGSQEKTQLLAQAEPVSIR